MIDRRFIQSIEELEGILYSKLLESKHGQLDMEEVCDMFDLKLEYGLKKVSGGAISMIRQREDVEQWRDEKGRFYLKLVE